MSFRYRNKMGQHLKRWWMGKKPSNPMLSSIRWCREHWNDLTINGDGHVI